MYIKTNKSHKHTATIEKPSRGLGDYVIADEFQWFSTQKFLSLS